MASTSSATVWVTEPVEVIFCSSGDFDRLSHQIFYYTVPERSRRHVLIPPGDFDSAQSPYYLLLHSVHERSRRHIISIALKSVRSIEHLWCSFENSKTLLFQQISVNFVILKQIQKIHTQWLRQAQPPIISLHGAWACRRHILTSHLGALVSRRHIISIALKPCTL